MVSAISSSLAGLSSASNRIEVAARKIASQNNTSVEDSAAVKPISSDDDIAKNLVDMKIASYDYKANLKAIKVQDNMQQSLLDILS